MIQRLNKNINYVKKYTKLNHTTDFLGFVIQEYVDLNNDEMLKPLLNNFPKLRETLTSDYFDRICLSLEENNLLIIPIEFGRHNSIKNYKIISIPFLFLKDETLDIIDNKINEYLDENMTEIFKNYKEEESNKEMLELRQKLFS